MSEKAKEFLAREGYDPAFGARPLKRAIQRRLQDPLAMQLLGNDVPEGSRVGVDLAENQEGLVFDVLVSDELPEGAGASGR